MIPMVPTSNRTHLFPTVPPLVSEFRGVWVATVANIDWPSQPGLSPAQDEQEFTAICENAKRIHLNAIILQVRPSGDAFYASKIEPWSEFLTGKQGKAPADHWDPLKFAVKEAHHYGLELHAWFNPYRARSSAQKGLEAENHISKTHPQGVHPYGKDEWMDPGDPVIKHQTERVILDVVNRYDIDGIHMDDYFYPYPVKGKDGKEVPFPDSKTYARYRANGGELDLGDWRRSNVSSLISEVYTDVKKLKPWVKVGISPFGIYRPGVPKGIKAGVDTYADLYADTLKWFQSGWCDYFSPQLYWPISQTPQAYGTLLSWWCSVNKLGRHLWIGNFTSRITPGEGTWAPKEILDQIEMTRQSHTLVDPGATGNIHFSAETFLKNSKDINGKLLQGPYARFATVPASLWLDKGEPVSATGVKANGGHLEIQSNDLDRVRFWLVSFKTPLGWTDWDCSDAADRVVPIGATEVAVYGLDKAEVPGQEKRFQLEKR